MAAAGVIGTSELGSADEARKPNEFFCRNHDYSVVGWSNAGCNGDSDARGAKNDDLMRARGG